MNIPLKCKCGALRGLATDIPESIGKRVICMCGDCQAYTHFLGCTQEVLDKNGGTEVVPMRPAHLKITHGLENLKCVRLSSDGMMRWYAGCCKMPIANTLTSSKIPFAGVVHTILDFSDLPQSRGEVMGPVSARVHGKYGIGPLPPDALQNGSLKLIANVMGFLAIGLIRRLQTPSPFFDATTGKPVVAPLVLPDSEYEKLRKLVGPRT